VDIRKGIRVVIADDHATIRKAVRQLLISAAGIDLVGEGCTGLEAINLVEELEPDVLILDLQMPVMDGVQVMDYLKLAGSPVRIIILSGFYEDMYTTEILTRGAWAYLLKEEASGILVDMIRKAARGDGQGTRPRPSERLVRKLISAHSNEPARIQNPEKQ
jgi:DNA-binding NarL/FixJ family response regulator